MQEWTPVIEAAREAGCPADQVENFIRAGVVLQPRQLMASSAARACDHAGGPVEVGFGGARGGGKSFWVLCQTAIDLEGAPQELRAAMTEMILAVEDNARERRKGGDVEAANERVGSAKRELLRAIEKWRAQPF